MATLGGAQLHRRYLWAAKWRWNHFFDGILARATGGSSEFGAFLDSTMDRLADGAVFGSLTAWAGLRLADGPLRTWTLCLGIACVVLEIGRAHV